MIERIDPANRVTGFVTTAIGLWLAVAVGIGLSGAYYHASAPVVGATNGVLVTVTLLALFLIRPLRVWAQRVSLRWLVLYHAVRFVGLAFLVLHASGALPAAFAVKAGWGDIVVAATALVVAFAAIPVTSRGRWWTVLLWNVFGLFDILMVLGTGMRLGLADPGQLAAITAFPMSLLPTFIVPLVIVTHVLIFIRLWETRNERRFR